MRFSNASYLLTVSQFEYLIPAAYIDTRLHIIVV